MSKSDTFESDILKLIFNANPIGNVADNAASSPLTQLFFALHSSDPGEAGTQGTNEVSYTGYARVGVNRTSGGFVVSGSNPAQAALAANLDFGACTAGSATATFFSVGVGSSGATKILYSGTITPNIGISAGVTPRLTTGTTITED